MARSKRKSTDEISGGAAKKRKENEKVVEAGAFGEMVSKAGFLLKEGDKANQLNCDQTMFRRDLEQAIERNQNTSQVIDDFIESLSKYFENTNRFIQALMPTLTSLDCDSSARSGNQDSLVRLLLDIDKLQPPTMNLLLEKLAEFTDEDEPVMNNSERVNVPRLILSQFRWLNHIVNSKMVTEKMLEIISVVSIAAQREIIACIPEVVDDAEHSAVAGELQILLVENSQLAVPILDAFSNLTLKEELLCQVRRSVMSTLDSVSVEDMPIIIRFLLQTVSVSDALDVISELRLHLDFNACFPPKAGTSAAKRKKDDHGRNTSNADSATDSESLILAAIQSGIRFQNSVADAWIKAIESVKDTAHHKVIDVFLVLILHSCGHKKAVEALVRNKVRAGLFSEALLRAAFSDHKQVLREYFPNVLALAEVLLRSPEPVIFHFAAAMYRHAFLSFNSYCQQEIVGTLVTHIGSGMLDEVDMSLNVLSELVEMHTEKMTPFAVFVKGVLDYIENLSMVQIRKLYKMLSELVYRNAQGESQIADELFIIIRKQLSNSDIRYKKMGVIGAIMVLECATSHLNNIVTSTEGSSELSMPDEEVQPLLSLLKLVRVSSFSNPSVVALFMDELTGILGSSTLGSQVQEWINENVMTDFQDDFVVDIAPESLKVDVMFEMEPQYGLDSESDGAIGINLLPIICKNITNETPPKDEKVLSALCLASQFRLLQTCERRQNEDNLDGIDALLGCPLYLPKADLFKKMESMSKTEKHTLCDCLFYTINWFREIVNAFATQTESDMKRKVITRLKNITDLQNMLPACLAVTSGYIPPTAAFDEDRKAAPISVNTRQGNAGKNAKKPTKSRKKGARDDDDDADESTISKPDQIGSPENNRSHLGKSVVESPKTDKSATSAGCTAYRPYLREFDMEVLTLLHTKLNAHPQGDANAEFQLTPAQLELLLADLALKLDHSLVSTANKRRTFLKSSSDRNCGFSHLDQLGPLEVAKNVTKLMPALCDHLEATSAFLQAQVASADDSFSIFGNKSQENYMASCFQLLLDIINTVCLWSGFICPENRSLLKENLCTLAARLNTSASAQTAFADLVKQSFQYIENFSNAVPNLSVGVAIIRVLASLVERTDATDHRKQIGRLALTFLQREWRDVDGELLKGAQHNEQIQLLLRNFLQYTENPMSALEKVTTEGYPELIQADKKGNSATYPSLTRNSFPVFYRVALAKLVECSRDILPGRSTDSSQMKLDRLLQWSLAVRVFHIHVNLIKVLDNRSNLSSIIKHGRQFVEVFLRQGMPLLDHCFRSHREEVQSLLKNIQLSTRALHHMAGHSKIIRDVSLTNLVPPLKKVLEAFIYRVKAMLTLNRCLEAFWLGNLKNRNLQGGELLTQVSAESSKDSDSGSDSLPEEESDEDDKVPSVLGEDNTAAGRESYSACY